jgi:putative phosphoribosyl transferase
MPRAVALIEVKAPMPASRHGLAMWLFEDRQDAGQQLAQRLAAFDLGDAVVVALPRGGLPVAAPIAARFRLPIDVLLIRKVGVPGQRELAVGAVSDGQDMQITVNQDIADSLKLSHEDIVALARRELPELERRRNLYFGDLAPEPLAGRTAIVVDDGVATGATARAALRLVRQRRPKHIIVALPVAPASSLAELGAEADAVVCLHQPEPFLSVGSHYRDFGQVDDREVTDLLHRHRLALTADPDDGREDHGDRAKAAFGKGRART